MKSIITGLAIAIVAGIALLTIEYGYFNPRSPKASASNVTSFKLPPEEETIQSRDAVNHALPGRHDESLIVGARLASLLKPAYPGDRLSLIKELGPKLAALSGSDAREALNLLYPGERVEGLKVLLSYIRKPLTDDETKAILALFYPADVPHAASLLTSSR